MYFLLCEGSACFVSGACGLLPVVVQQLAAYDDQGTHADREAARMGLSALVPDHPDEGHNRRRDKWRNVARGEITASLPDVEPKAFRGRDTGSDSTAGCAALMRRRVNGVRYR